MAIRNPSVSFADTSPKGEADSHGCYAASE